MRQYFFDSRLEFFTDMGGRWIERTYFLTPFRVDFQSGDQFSLRVEPSYTYLPEDFRIRTGSKTITLPQGNDYQFTRYTFQVNTANRRKISGTGSVGLGTFYSGHRRNIQYDSVSRLLGWQTRFRWIVKPGNDLYFVWLQNWIDTGTQLTTTDRSAAAKVVYTYRF